MKYLKRILLQVSGYNFVNSNIKQNLDDLTRHHLSRIFSSILFHNHFHRKYFHFHTSEVLYAFFDVWNKSNAMPLFHCSFVTF